MAVGLLDWLALEGDSAFAPSGITGSLGLRLSGGRKQGDGKGFALDLGFGGGAGKGGVRCNNSHNLYYEEDHFAEMDDNNSPCPEDRLWDLEDSKDRLTWGGYYELGLGGYLSGRVGIFVRQIVQLADSDGVPPTLWYAGYAGPHFFLGRSGIVSLHASGGPGYYKNKWDARWYAVAHLGLVVRFGKRGIH